MENFKGFTLATGKTQNHVYWGHSYGHPYSDYHRRGAETYFKFKSINYGLYIYTYIYNILFRYILRYIIYQYILMFCLGFQNPEENMSPHMGAHGHKFLSSVLLQFVKYGESKQFLIKTVLHFLDVLIIV